MRHRKRNGRALKKTWMFKPLAFIKTNSFGVKTPQLDGEQNSKFGFLPVEKFEGRCDGSVNRHVVFREQQTVDDLTDSDRVDLGEGRFLWVLW